MKPRPESRGWLRPAFCLALTAVALALGSSRAAAQATPNPPERLTYQGFLVDGNGLALGNAAPKNYDVIFRIYDDQSGGAMLWAEQQTVTVDKGYFSVLLGEGASTGEPRPGLSTLFKGPTASDRFVGITVKGIGAGGANVDISPRLRLLSSPYAFLAQQAVKVVRTDNGNDLLTSSGNAVTVGGPMTATSFTGDGTALTGVAKLSGGNTFSGNQAATSFSGDGSGLTGVAKLNGGNSFSGNQLFGSGNVYMDNTYTVQAKNSSGIYEPFLWPRWSDNVSYLNYGSGGFNIRNNGSSPVMFMQNNGLVGIGTTTPGTTLQVAGGIRARGGFPGGGGVNNNGYTFSGNGGDTDSGMFSDQDGHLRWTTDSSLRMSLNNSGLFVHGANFEVQSYNGVTFRVINNVMQLFEANNKGQYAQMWRYPNGVAIAGGGGGWGNASGDFRQITWDGDGNWDASSDRKFKKDIVDAEPLLERALQVQVRRFRWKDDPADAKLSLGVIAQELQPLFPDLIAVQENPTTKETNLAVGYSDFGLIAVKAIQELKTRQDKEITDLKAEMAELKAQMKEMLRVNAELRTQSGKTPLTAAAGQ